MTAKTYYIGLGVTYHDPALAIVDDNGAAVFAEAAERFLQYKRALNGDADNPYRLGDLLREYCPDAGRFVLALNWRRKRPCYERTVAALGLLSARGMFHRDIKRLGSPLENYQLHHMMACNRHSIARGGLNLARLLRECHPGCAVEFRDFDHHDAHAASACYGSPFEEAACAVVDSYGENGAMAFYRFAGGRLRRLHEARGVGSLGLYYMKITELCGFDWLKGEEWKVMGLAPHGRLDKEVYALLQDILRVDGLDLRHPRANRMAASLAKLEAKKRNGAEPVERAADLAYTGQYFFNQRMMEVLTNFHRSFPSERLALAGGCALNSSCNGQIPLQTPYRELYVPPAPADDGSALGAAWLAFYAEHPDHPREPARQTPYLGSTLAEASLRRLVRFAGGLRIQHLPANLGEETARLLSAGKLVAWVQGRAEFGPRALGNRSILADPRDPAMKERINSLVKCREQYRPFAPSILHEHGPGYFEDYRESPYMERALRWRADAAERVPAVVHVDRSGRLQSVRQQANPRFHRLLEAFFRQTGIPLLLNTSFNVMGKPIVHSVEDAIAVFMTSGLDALAIGDYLIAKPDSPCSPS